MKKLKMLLLFCLLGVAVYAQNITINGHLKDASNGEDIVGGAVYIVDLQIGSVSNTYGFYSLTLPQGSHTLRVSCVGYETINQDVIFEESQTLSFSLLEDVHNLEEVEVRAEAENHNVESLEIGTAKLPIKMVKKLPSFMGEVDIIRSIQLLPGIQSGGEASSGLFVRGGGPDENLMLLDEAPVYNASHLMGFFSVFNSNAIKGIDVYKGGIPAKYGGKASSVIDIRQKDGNAKQLGIDGGLGILSSRLTFEGPIIKDKWTFILAGRRTYYDVLGRAMGIDELQDNTLYFYDLNAKSTYRINEKNHLFISAYIGEDDFVIDDYAYMRWGNMTSTVRWNHVFGDKLFFNTSFIYSRYDYNLGAEATEASTFDWISKITDYSGKLDFSWYVNPNNTLTFGGSSIKHDFVPGKVTSGDAESFISDMELAHYNALESALYLSNEQKITSRFSAHYGLRFSYFQQMGIGEVNIYEDSDNLDDDEIVETVVYDDWEKIGDPFVYLEPRLSMRYSLTGNSSMKASYNRMVQNLHLISNTNSPTPLDIWLPSSTYIKPLIVDQVSAGYFRNFKDNMIETSAEVYYKNMQNVLDYKDGAELFLNDNIETELLHGKGQSMGVEALVKKAKGDLTGWIGYTLSRTTRQIDGINDGKAYVSSYDRTHDLSVVASYQLNDYWNFGTCFVFTTGISTTYPIGKYYIDENQVYQYGERNSSRLPNYHRLDLSATYDFKKNKGRMCQQSLNVSFYNVYARRNAYSVSAQQSDTDPNVTEFVQLSIVGTIIPSITYNFKF